MSKFIPLLIVLLLSVFVVGCSPQPTPRTELPTPTPETANLTVTPEPVEALGTGNDIETLESDLEKLKLEEETFQ